MSESVQILLDKWERSGYASIKTRVFTIQEAADLLRVHTVTIRRHMKKAADESLHLPSHRMQDRRNKPYGIRSEDLARWAVDYGL